VERRSTLPSVPAAQSRHPIRPRLLWLAYVSGAFGLAASGHINFRVPLRARELGASFDVIGLLVGAGAALPAVLSVTTGAGCSVFVTNYWWFLALQPQHRRGCAADALQHSCSLHALLSLIQFK
jgi:hypothetical protein